MRTRTYLLVAPWVILAGCGTLVLWAPPPIAYVGAVLGMITAMLGAVIYWTLG
jgi:hypothetical protein